MSKLLSLALVGILGSVVSITHAEDSVLVNLHATLIPLRGVVGDQRDLSPAKAGPVLVDAGHQLRAWIEIKLLGLAAEGDTDAFTRRLNQELQQTGLFCDAEAERVQGGCGTGDHTGFWDMSGYLAPVKIARQSDGRVLVVTTALGVPCGVQQSIYAYEMRERQWQRIWQDELDIKHGKYLTTRYIDAAYVSPPSRNTGDRLALSLSNDWGCVSNWHPVYYRLWGIKAAGTAGSRPLLDGHDDFAYLGQHTPPLQGSVGFDDALIEFRKGSLDSGVHSYETVRHYSVKAGKLKRIDPIALSPRAFTEEWLGADWSESKTWLVTGAPSTSLHTLHRRLHDYHSGDFNNTQSCAHDPELWQVGVAFDNGDKASVNAYFLVRWRPPYHFEMLNVMLKPRKDCFTQADAGIDGEHSLFPVQEWRE